MKIQVKRSILIEGKGVDAHAVVECDKTIGNALIKMGDAVLVEASTEADTVDVVQIETIEQLKAKLVEQAGYIDELEKSNEALEAENDFLKEANAKLEAENKKLEKAKEKLVEKLKAGGSTDAS